ncbi:hypothetical protein AS189_12185 [Arthrobacter alpinus]|uniref:beta-N-acetylhexosaminidase n=1 Tax=Arthrobacter alpinus TaxID=656366 RepID=A0A0S2M086_9MICC|nr:hypothetical protein AS189_12185 [Arthrobacter alpinus]
MPTAFTAQAAPPAQAAPIVVPPPAPVALPNNLALTGTATAHSVETAIPGNVAANAIDGKVGTRWSSNAGNAGWFQVELATAGPVDNVKIQWPAGAARNYTLQTSVDGTTWTDVKVITSSTGPARVDEIKVGASNVKFVRAVLASQWATFGYSISEFEIYDKAVQAVPANPALVPLPSAVAQTADGTFRLTPSSRIVATGDAVAAATYFAQKARKSTGFALPVVFGTPIANDIAVTVAPGLSEDKAESYALQADAAGVRVEANTAAGALNGVQTLRQLFPQWIESDAVVTTPWTVDGVVISDYPRYEYRGIQIDVARSFYTVDEMKEHIDNAAQFKFNRLHLHLTDDQGWRIAMDQPAANPSGIKYTDLTDISGKTAMTYNDAGVMQGTELGHTGFYTKADYQEIVSYAGENGMVVVPEIDMPGHTNAALHAIPQLNSAGSAPKPAPGTDTPPHQGSGNVGGTTFDADNAATYEFTKEVLTQLAAMTPGPYLHIGGDESHVTPHDKYVTMVDAFVDQVHGLDKQVIGWNEYSSANLPKDSIVQYWAGNRQSTATKILANNLKAILSPAEKTYIPQKQDNAQSAGGTWACGGPCTLETHYDWNPENYLPGVMDDRILGVETVQWGEWIRGMEQTETYQYPRGLATAEVGWSAQSERSYADFTKRAGQLGGRMALQDLTHFKTTGVNWTTAPDAPAAAPALVDPAQLPATSPVDLAVPATEFDGGEYVTLKNLPANAWLLLAVHDGATAAFSATSTNGWVRSNAAGEAPLIVPTGLTAGEHVVSVQIADGSLAGFASLMIAEEAAPETSAPVTTPPATLAPTTDPTVDPTTDPTTAPTTDPTTDPTVDPTLDPTTDPTSPSATTAPSDSATTTGPAVTDPATDSTNGAAPTQVTASSATPSHGTNQDGLASTGAKSTLMIGGALLALLAGLVIVAGSRRRLSKH